MTGLANPYAGQDLFVPRAHHDSYDRFCKVGRSEGKDLDGAPFPRMVDMWWVAMCIGVREGIRTPLGEVTKFADGTIFGSDMWRIAHLGLLALQIGGDELLDRPAEIVRIACEFAATGSAVLLEQLAPHARPMKPLLTFLRDLAGEA